jgi:hypothetical protein
MKRIMLALAAVACLSVPALADEDGSGPVRVPYAEPAAPIGYVGHHDGCDHDGRFHDRFSQRQDWGHGPHDRRFDRDGYDR